MIQREHQSLAGDDRSAAEVVGIVLLIGIVLVGIAVLLLVGMSQLSGGQDGVEVGQAEQGLTEFDARASRVATGSTTSQTVDLGLRGNGGTLAVEPDRGNITIVYTESIYSSGGTEILNTSLGTVLYRQGRTTVGYQGGGVWRSDGAGSTMVSPPEISFSNHTLTLPVIRTTTSGSVHSDLQITAGEPSRQRFPNASVPELSNKIESGMLQITIQSQYYRAWGRYFDDEVNTDVIYPRPGTVMIIFFGDVVDYSPSSGIIATSGPGELRVEGSGSYIDSYNSSVGAYEDTRFQEGIVKSAGDVLLYGGSQIYGDVDSNKRVNLSGGSEITGNVSAIEGWETDGDSKIHGETDYDANVPILPPIDGYVASRTGEIARYNDNGNTSVIEDDALDISGSGELQPGSYYLSKIDMEDNETLVLNASAGDITLAVDEYIRLDEGQITVTGDVDDGVVRVFAASNGNSSVVVPGSGGYVAEHFYVDGESHISVDNDASPRFQVLAPARFTGAIRASGSDDPQVTATIIAPTLGNGPGQFLVRDSELFGGVVTGNLTAENNAEVHFDHAVMNARIPIGEGSRLLEYLYVSEHEIHVEDG